MIHRILKGQKASAMARDLLNQHKIVMAWDLSPDFANCVRVLSLPTVITSQDQLEFDNLLADEGVEYNVTWRNDVGAYLGVVGIQIQAV